MAVLERKHEKPTNRKRRPQVFAGACPQCEGEDTYIARTMNVVRYCHCRECGRRWPIWGPPKDVSMHGN